MTGMRGEWLREWVSDLENRHRGTPYEPYIAPLRALADATDPDADANPDAYTRAAAWLEYGMYVEIALGHLGGLTGPERRAALVRLRTSPYLARLRALADRPAESAKPPKETTP